ncbi:MAG: hypothetical protein MN733_05670, partial [Nitrososphaera sp.]|nr:hypothetical protein [Nitrososphaera sp.]
MMPQPMRGCSVSGHDEGVRCRTTTRVRREGRAEAAFWRSAVWLPAAAARVADRPAGIGLTIDATRPIGMETALSMARL